MMSNSSSKFRHCLSCTMWPDIAGCVTEVDNKAVSGLFVHKTFVHLTRRHSCANSVSCLICLHLREGCGIAES